MENETNWINTVEHQKFESGIDLIVSGKFDPIPGILSQIAKDRSRDRATRYIAATLCSLVTKIQRQEEAEFEKREYEN